MAENPASSVATTAPRAWGSWIALALGLGATTVVTFSVKSDTDASNRREFDFACSEIRLNIAARLAANAQILHSGAALFNTADTVTRANWRTFTDNLRVDDFLPGTQGIGFTQLVRPDQLQRHILSVRTEGFHEYVVKPAGPRAIYSAIVYLEPFTGRNLRAFGYDMMSESVRRTAMERARDSNRTALSGKVTLVQETNKDVQAGALMFVPVYRKGAATSSVEQRRTALKGWVYSPYRMKDLMQGTLRGWDAKIKNHPIVLQVFDGDSVTNSALMYDSRSASDSSLDSLGMPSRTTTVDFAGRRWTLRIRQLGESASWTEYRSEWIVLLSGSVISILLFWLVRSLSNTRTQARKLAEKLTKELRESEESYRNQFATNSSVMLLIDPSTGAILDANEAAQHFYGHTKSQFLSLRIFDLNTIPEEDVKRNMASVPKGVGSRFQFQHRLADGSKREVEVSASSIQFGGRRVLHSIIHDVTERKQAEEALRKLAERLGLATKAGGVGIWEYEVATNLLVWDEQMFRLYGITDGEFGGAYEAWKAGVHPDDRERGDQEIQDALRGEREFDTEFRVLWPDGSTHHIRALGLVRRDDEGRPIRMVGTNWDITEQKLSEEALRQSEKKISQLLQTTDQGIYGIDPQGRCTFINRSGLKMLGYTLDECVGRDMHELIHHSRADGAAYPVTECPIFRAKNSGLDSKIDDEVFWRKDGTSFPAEYSSYPVVEDDEIHGAVVTFSDITERKRAEEALRRTNLELEVATARAGAMAEQAAKANSAKSEFLANMSHEIRTPMNGVMGMTDLLLDTKLDTEQMRFTEIIRQSSESLLALINDILDFSKIEAGKLEMETIDFDLRALVDDLAAAQAPRIQGKGLEFICAVSPFLPNFLRGDPGRLRQILTNLIGNAIKFTNAGQIALRVELETESDDEATLLFRVQDTGIGIPEDKQAMLFQKFIQVDASTTRQFGGTGLGLAICKQLSEMMGGRIGVVSGTGDGSEFWFTAAFSKQPDSTRPIIVPADVRDSHLLVVEDNASSREAIVAQLVAWGARVEDAADGPTALGALYRARDARDPFQVAILDMRMPGMDGTALARAIKSDDTLVATKLVLMTSLGRPGDGKRMEALGFAGYLSKPARQSDFFDVLSTVLGHAPQAAPLPMVTRHSVREMRRGAVRILLAEDNVTNQLVAQGMLQKMGLRADTVADGNEALAALAKSPYDLVLMDVQMPVMDGLEATRRIRDRTSSVLNHDIPVVAMTANAMQGDREACLGAGMSDYVTKPIQPDTLAGALDRWLPKESWTSPEIVTNPVQPTDPDLDQAPAVFEWDKLVARMMKDPKLARRVVNGSRDELPVQLVRLKASVEADDLPASLLGLHAIKGSAANIGGAALSALARRIEIAAMTGGLQDIKAGLPRLETELARLLEAMAERP